MNVLGRWQKISDSTCSGQYPAVIDFKPDGLYSTESDPRSPVHPIWDVGTFSVDSNQVHLSTANDAIVAYKTTQAREQLTFQAPDGCVIAYRRL
ncbi:hypothetical protein [Spirosoma rigui]|uniref:hypothetical protein n=1 Tax=Spirosoma rigui TaxID=564064 RepID=UPI0009AF9749|nr:hypothetical protein [Spirosoma rigui]